MTHTAMMEAMMEGGDNAWNDSEGSGGDKDGNQRGDGGK